MESYSNLTDHELLYQLNKAIEKHDLIKKEGFELADKIQELEDIVEKKVEEMKEVELAYVQIMEELTTRKKNDNI